MSRWQRECSVYNANTGTRLREATADEVDEHFMACSRSNLVRGSKLGFPGKELWVDLTLPSQDFILAWVNLTRTPIIKTWKYEAQVFTKRDGMWMPTRTLHVKDTVAAAYARARNAGRIENVNLTMPAGKSGHPGKRIFVSIPEDEPGLPPDAIIDAWYREMNPAS